MKQLKTVLLAVVVLVFTSTGAMAIVDLDGDGIDDAVENQLLQRFAPILYPNEIHNVPEGGAGVPVSVSWLLRNSRMTYFNAATTNWVVALDRPSLSAAVAQVNNSGTGAANYSLRNYYLWGDSPSDVRSWPISISLGEGVYGRVWRPWSNYPHIYSVQYFVLLTWNETSYSGGNGNHESDWVCVDFAIDIRTGYDNPPIIHAIYHNHGQQNFVTPELLEYENGHPVVYIEKGTNEAWPNRGTRGLDGWPRSNGFATDVNWDDHTEWWQDLLIGIFTWYGQEVSEYKIHREHDGNGNRYATHNVPNIGDVHPTNGAVSLCGDEGMFLLRYQGKYGYEYTDILNLADVSPPTGPPWQDKMWDRAWKDGGTPVGPWTRLRDPFSSDTSGFHLYTTVVNSPPPVHYTFTVPQLLNPTYVDLNVVSEGIGSPAQPYKNLLLGIAMTADGGTVTLQPGNTSLRFTINQPVTLTAPKGIVTIGQ